MFGPLMFPTQYSDGQLKNSEQKLTYMDIGDDEDLENVTCLLCNKEFLFPNEKELLLAHLLKEHYMIISDVHLIADLGKYLKYWKEKFNNTIDVGCSDNSAGGDFKQYCTVLLADAKDKISGVLNEKQEFYLLSEAEILDKTLRENLQKERLEVVLEQQRIEREDVNFSRECLYCRQILSPTRNEFLTHLSTQHNLQLGNPSNLVYVDKLIGVIEEKLNNLQCIYCEKFFKDRNVLKEHMRKKLHKRINPNNEMYDKFYIINYIEPGTSWREREKSRRNNSSKKSTNSCASSTTGTDNDTTDFTDDDDDDSAENDDWSDWGDQINEPIMCLFCDKPSSNWTGVIEHMINLHSFNYEEHSLALDFYEQVKLVNYIRRQVFKNRCITCDKELQTREELLKHMTDEKHLDMPQRSLWNQPEFFFPTYENDAFLCQLEDKREEEEKSEINEALCEINAMAETQNVGIADEQDFSDT